MSDHPSWILGLVARVADYEDFHTRIEAGEEWRCFGNALAEVPQEVRQQARGYAQAKRDALHDVATDIPPSPPEEVAVPLADGTATEGDEPGPTGDHYMAIGQKGDGPGECGAECKCGFGFYGFDSLAEAVEHLDKHIANPDPRDTYDPFRDAVEAGHAAGYGPFLDGETDEVPQLPASTMADLAGNPPRNDAAPVVQDPDALDRCGRTDVHHTTPHEVTDKTGTFRCPGAPVEPDADGDLSEVPL